VLEVTPQGGDEEFVKFPDVTYTGILNAEDGFNDKVIVSPE